MDDNPILKKKQIEVLAPLDHTKIEYEEFEKNFYDEPEEIANLTDNEVGKPFRHKTHRLCYLE
jgi:hypothetical protein